MKPLSDDGMHDIVNESWNAYGQFTYVTNWKLAFPAAYTNLNGSTNSLLPTAERSFTGTATLYLGARLWSGAEAYLVPEVITELPFDQLRGLGGAIQNSELQKGGGETPQIDHSRAFVKQTFGFGGERVVKESGPMQLGTTYDSRRLVLIAGNFSILDFFDKNAFDIDPHQSFLSLGFLTYGAWDCGFEGLMTGRLERASDRPHLGFKAGIGHGIVQHFGAPGWRVLVGVELVSQRPKA